MFFRSTTIEARVARLEKINSLLVLAFLIAAGFAVRNALEAEPDLRVSSIQMVGDDGGVAAELSMRDGSPGLYLMDGGGTTRLALFHSAEATGLYVNDDDEVTRIGVAQFAHGGGGVALHGQDARGAAVLYFKETGSLRFFDADGNVTNSVSAAPE